METAPLRVLIIDDNPGDAKLVEFALGREAGAGFHCERADRLGRALERLKGGPFDVVLLDLHLPDATGTEGLRRIREVRPDLPVVGHSGSSEAGPRAEVLAAGADGFIVKGPPELGRYARTLRAAVDRRQLARSLSDLSGPDLAILEALGELGQGVAVVREGRLGPTNARFRELGGLPNPVPSELPDWLQGRLAEIPLGEAPREVGEPGPPPHGGCLVRLSGLRTGPGSGSGLLILEPMGAGPSSRPIGWCGDDGPSEVPPAADRSPRSAGEGTAIDPAAWAQVRELAGTDTRFLRALVDEFLVEGRRLDVELERSGAQGDLLGLERAAHSLKSTAAQLGANRAAERLRAIERAAQEGRLDEARAALPGARDEVARAFRALTSGTLPGMSNPD